MRDLIDDLHAAEKVAVKIKESAHARDGLGDNNLIGVLDTYAGRIDEAATDKITAIVHVASSQFGLMLLKALQWETPT